MTELATANQVAHTLTACTRCRSRKTRCDPGLPRCGPCTKALATCEYTDASRGIKIPRNYVVYLQHKVRNLERQLAQLERAPTPNPPLPNLNSSSTTPITNPKSNDSLDCDDSSPLPTEDLMRGASNIRLCAEDDGKFLGASSGIAITRLVMQLAKQFTASKSIRDIVTDERKMFIKSRFELEAAKPTSKVYPLISNVPAEELPTRDLMERLVMIFYLKVHPMYPIFHEPSFNQVIDSVYHGSPSAYENFCIRIVIAISLQKIDTQFAGLADSYYLAALKYMEACIKPMNMETLQCLTLIGVYSLLTPTRTGVYYMVGLAVRLVEALGIQDERTLHRWPDGRAKSALEVDMSRRLFWIAMSMDFGLAHGLGRPSCFAVGREYINVDFPALVDDELISHREILQGPTSLKKWIAVHFYRMRLLQLEIRKMLYQRKRQEPQDDQHPWFKDIEQRMREWRDTSPEFDAGSGLNKVWFIGRYNIMIVFLLRPSPQIPRPSTNAAQRCYDACKYIINMQRAQIESRTVDLTWIFTQTIFMAVNTLLWSLSYAKIRFLHVRHEVEALLLTALECISLAANRWPGVLSALELYQNLIAACLCIYDKQGDIAIFTGSDSSSRNASDSPLAVSCHNNMNVASVSPHHNTSGVVTMTGGTSGICPYKGGSIDTAQVGSSQRVGENPPPFSQILNSPCDKQWCGCTDTVVTVPQNLHFSLANDDETKINTDHLREVNSTNASDGDSVISNHHNHINNVNGDHINTHNQGIQFSNDTTNIATGYSGPSSQRVEDLTIRGSVDLDLITTGTGNVMYTGGDGSENTTDMSILTNRNNAREIDWEAWEGLLEGDWDGKETGAAVNMEMDLDSRNLGLGKDIFIDNMNMQMQVDVNAGNDIAVQMDEHAKCNVVMGTNAITTPDVGTSCSDGDVNLNVQGTLSMNIRAAEVNSLVAAIGAGPGPVTTTTVGAEAVAMGPGSEELGRNVETDWLFDQNGWSDWPMLSSSNKLAYEECGKREILLMQAGYTDAKEIWPMKVDLGTGIRSKNVSSKEDPYIWRWQTGLSAAEMEELMICLETDSCGVVRESIQGGHVLMCGIGETKSKT